MAFKVLVADDSVTIQKIVAMALENEDMEVEGIANGREAWERMDSFKPDLVLADLDMPGMPGFDLSKKIKSSGTHSKVKVVLLTSDFEDFDEKEFVQSDADDYISKPFKSEDILGLVKGLLSDSEPSATPAEEVAIDLSPDDIIEELTAEEPAKEEPATLELTADDIVEDESAIVELPPEDRVEDAPAEPEKEPAPLELTADDIVEEAPDASPALELSPEDMVEETPEESAPALELSADDMVEETQESPEPALELSADDMDEEEPDPMLLSPDDLLENFPEEVPAEDEASEGRVVDDTAPVATSQEGDAMVLTADDLDDFDPSAAFEETLDAPIAETEQTYTAEEKTEEPEPVTSHQTVLDEVIHEIESLADPEDMMNTQNEPEVDESSPEFFIGERAASPDDMDDLDRAFRTVANLPEVEEEPDDLLENMASQSLAQANEGKPDLIRESLSFMTEKKPPEETDNNEPVDEASNASPSAKPAPASRQENLDEVMARHALRLIESNLDKALKKEMAGLSDTIVQTVREVVKEVAPDVIRSVIQEEIENIRKTEVN